MRARRGGNGGVPMLLFKLGMWSLPVRARCSRLEPQVRSGAIPSQAVYLYLL